MSFSERLKIIVEEDFNTQVNFAEAIRVTKASVNDYLSSRRKPNFDVLQKIANLGYNMNWVFTGIGTRKKELMNLELLDNYDESIIESIIVHVGGMVKVKKFVPNVRTSSEEISNYVLKYLYYQNTIEALYLELCSSKSFLLFEKSVKCNTSLDSFVFESILPAIDNYLKTEEVYNHKTKSGKNITFHIVDDYEFIHSLANIYVVYSEIIALEDRIKDIGSNNLTNMKDIFKQILDLMNNSDYLMVKSNKFYNVISKTFNIEYP